MSLFLKGFIIGIAKIIPGVSGAMIAVSFGIYDRLINAVTNFFEDVGQNSRFLLLVGSGILVSIVFFSGIIRYFISNYYFVTMMLFVGLIVGGTYNFSKNVNFNIKNSLGILLLCFIIVFISIININRTYVISGSYIDYLMFFIGGIVEIFSSIVPGISGTALLMLIGIYDNVLILFSNIFNISFILDNIMIYVSYTIGMIISFIICSLFISYLLKKYRSLFDTIVFGLSLSSILLLLLMIFKSEFCLIELLLGIILLFVGITISYLFDR